MKADTIAFALVAIIATVTSLALDSNVTSLPLKFALASTAVDTLNAHGLWGPDSNSFAQGEPNVGSVNATAENLKFEASGLDINDLVTIRMSNQTTAAAAADNKAIANTDVCKP